MLRPSDLDVRHVMSKGLFTFEVDTPIGEAASVLLEARLSGAPVIEDGDLKGVVSTTALLRAYAGGKAAHEPVGAIAEPGTTVEADAHLTEACRRMVRARAHRLVVLDRGEPIGVLSAVDVVRALACLEPKAITWDPLTQTIELAEELP